MTDAERPIEIELEDCQIEWLAAHPGDKVLELFPDDQADEVIVTSMKNCIDLIDWNKKNGYVHPDDIEEEKALRDACLLIIKHFGTEPSDRDN